MLLLAPGFMAVQAAFPEPGSLHRTNDILARVVLSIVTSIGLLIVVSFPLVEPDVALFRRDVLIGILSFMTVGLGILAYYRGGFDWIGPWWSSMTGSEEE